MSPIERNKKANENWVKGRSKRDRTPKQRAWTKEFKRLYLERNNIYHKPSVDKDEF